MDPDQARQYVGPDLGPNVYDTPDSIHGFFSADDKVSKGAKIRSRYNQVPRLTQDTNGKVTSSQLDTTNESQEVSPFPAGDHKANTNRRAQRHSKYKTEQQLKRSTKEVPPWNVPGGPRMQILYSERLDWCARLFICTATQKNAPT